MDNVLEKYILGYDQLSEDEKQAIHYFSVLWTFFEAKILETTASVKKIKKKSLEWEKVGKLAPPWFNDTLDYFIDRYIDKSTGDTKDKFAALNFGNNDDEAFVTSVLKKKKNKYSEQLAACLIIVYRFRNNLFHGSKWGYEMKDQKENFYHSIKLI